MSTLQASDVPLTRRYDVAMLDLDGVVYVGPDAVPAAPEALRAARQQGLKLAFVTNNAARTPQRVAQHLGELGIEAEASEVITSAQAAARWLGDRLPPGATVLVVGTTGLLEALRERGLTPVDDASGHVDAVVQGYSPDTNWRMLAEGAVAIRRGVPWVATNLDPTVPSPRGPLPGNGSMVAALRLATGVEPEVTGKPDPTMHRETLIRTDAQAPIVVGDRLDTDIEGANAVGCASLLVFTGVTGVGDLLAASPQHRPTYLAADVSGLLVTHPGVEVTGGTARCGRWLASRGSEHVELAASGARSDARATADPGQKTDESDWALASRLDEDGLDAIRAACAAAWSDRSGDDVDKEPRPVREIRSADGDQEARGLLDRLGLPDQKGPRAG